MAPAGVRLAFLILYSLLFTGHPDWSKNTYLRLMVNLAKGMNKSTCWICMHTPTYEKEGIPLIGIPLNATGLVSDEWLKRDESLKSLDTTQYVALSGWTRGELWIKFMGETFIGSSQCEWVLHRAKGRWSLNNSTGPVMRNRRRVMEPLCVALGHQWFSYYNETCTQDEATIAMLMYGEEGVRQDGFAHILPPLMGTTHSYWWICGHKAWKKLPINSKGSCYIGLLAPGIRIVDTFPKGLIRNYRKAAPSHKILNAYKDLKAPGQSWLRGIFPYYGAAANHLDILRICTLLENFMNETADALTMINTELKQIRQFVLQNRIALDYLLTSQGGVCGLIGPECCTYIVDGSVNITGSIDNIRLLASKVHEVKTSGWQWSPGDWFGGLRGWIKSILLGLLLGMLFLFTLYILINCVLFCLKKTMQKTTQMLTPAEVRQMYLEFDRQRMEEEEEVLSIMQIEMGLERSPIGGVRWI
ncbi:endogenous retrovirus group 3 member 1 Env polyprotein-like [Rhineura floridana]|uniref:endogenous retrovirus group 3 member 1 Env polyprotein-like n=1 Tax=Rhineura floridana TaxID=261503 RepID=UPI002AC86A23|nr:endogenous retrovirus group 3 member 1 Env polyprotein-like [Rhineura floridana]